MANDKGVFRLATKRGIKMGPPGVQLVGDTADPTDNGLLDGRLSYLTGTGVRARIAGAWQTLLTAIANGVKQTQLDYAVIAVTVLAAATTGTGTVVANAIVLGIYPTGNQDQFVDNVAIAGTTLTVTLAAAATANNTFNVVVLNA
jgi:hypothetical protein